MADDAWNTLMAMELLETRVCTLQDWCEEGDGWLNGRLDKFWNGQYGWLRDHGFIFEDNGKSGVVYLIWHDNQIAVYAFASRRRKRPYSAWIGWPEEAVGSILATMALDVMTCMNDFTNMIDIQGITDSVCRGRSWESWKDSPAEAITNALAKFIKTVYAGRDMIMKCYKLEKWPCD